MRLPLTFQSKSAKKSLRVLRALQMRLAIIEGEIAKVEPEVSRECSHCHSIVKNDTLAGRLVVLQTTQAMLRELIDTAR